jgi:hypothetical protein
MYPVANKSKPFDVADDNMTPTLIIPVEDKRSGVDTAKTSPLKPKAVSIEAQIAGRVG